MFSGYPSVSGQTREWGKCWTWWVSLTSSNCHHFLSKILGNEQHSRVQSWFQEVLPGKPTPANSNFLMPAHKKTTGCERGKWRGSNFFFKLVWSSWSAFYFTLTKWRYSRIVQAYNFRETDCQSGIFCEFDESLWKKMDGACAKLLWYFTQLNCPIISCIWIKMRHLWKKVALVLVIGGCVGANRPRPHLCSAYLVA